MPALPTVADLLAVSKHAHLEYRRYAGSCDTKGKITQAYDEPKCVAAVERAKAAREQAHDLDPEHVDPAWQTPNGALHVYLLQFYEKFLSDEPERLSLQSPMRSDAPRLPRTRPELVEEPVAGDPVVTPEEPGRAAR